MDDAWAAWKQKVKEIAINEWKKEKEKEKQPEKEVGGVEIVFGRSLGIQSKQ